MKLASFQVEITLLLGKNVIMLGKKIDLLG